VENNFVTVESMDPVIEKYRELHSNDLEERLGLNDRSLPSAFCLSTLINPMFGLQKTVVAAGLMSDSQYRKARSNLLSKMQDILDVNNPQMYDDDDSSDDSEDEEVPDRVNINYDTAVAELNKLDRIKKKKYRPQFVQSKSKVLVGDDDTGYEHQIMVGPVSGRGKDLPSGKNLFDYVDCRGRIDLIRFFGDHVKTFPTLWVVVQCESARRVVEVGCERFFGLSGYVSSPRRSRLGVRNYERIAMLAMIVQTVYIDEEWVAKEYLRRCKFGAWKKENTVDALKCWNLERIIEAKIFGRSVPDELTMDEFINEDASSNSDVVVLD
jgi:hypothetical protein